MNTRYVIIFVLIMTSSVALVLTSFREATKDQAAQNEAIFNKRAILAALGDNLGNGMQASTLTDAQVLDIFAKQVEQVVVNAAGEQLEGVQAENIDMAKERKLPESERSLPVFIYNNGTEKFYILSVRGNGLWDEIWGNIALESDLNTLAGASFDHKGETPGLGAEIKDNPAFSAMFEGTKIYNEQGEYVSIKVRKGGAVDRTHEVDGISGATVTADGVSQMLYKGLKLYQPYLESQRGQKQESLLINQ